MWIEISFVAMGESKEKYYATGARKIQTPSEF